MPAQDHSDSLRPHTSDSILRPVNQTTTPCPGSSEENGQVHDRSSDMRAVQTRAQHLIIRNHHKCTHRFPGRRHTNTCRERERERERESCAHQTMIQTLAHIQCPSGRSDAQRIRPEPSATWLQKQRTSNSIPAIMKRIHRHRVQ